MENSKITLSDFYLCSYPRGRAFIYQSGDMLSRDIQTHVFLYDGHFKEAKQKAKKNDVPGHLVIPQISPSYW